MILVVKVTTNKEDQATDMIATRSEKKNLGIYSVLRPHGLRGYIILESEDFENAEKATSSLPYIKGVIKRKLAYKEIDNMVVPVVTAIKIEPGDIVEMLTEPFKREKAKVTRINKQKEEVVVELLESAIPIPVTVKLDNVKVIRRTKEEGEEDKGEEKY